MEQINKAGIDINSISTVITDSGSNMVKMVKLLRNKNHQRCLAHVLHLSVK